MQLLYATGMRVSELVGLPLSAARGDPRMLLIRGKGGKERMVPLSPPAREALTAWVATRDAQEDNARLEGYASSGFLFPSRGKAGHLTRHAFYLRIKDLAVRAGVSPDKVMEFLSSRQSISTRTSRGERSCTSSTTMC